MTLEGKRLVYLDNACQSLRPRQVIDAIGSYYDVLGCCPGSISSSNALAAKTAAATSEARVKVARFLQVAETEVIWQPNTTYGINLVAMSLSSPLCSPSIRLRKGDDVVTTDMEHHSGLLPFWRLEQERGIRHRIFSVEGDGTIDLQKFQEFLTRKTKLVSVVWASNVTGTISPIEEVVKIAHDNGSLILVDGAQYVPHHSVDLGTLKMDFAVFSIHKMCGPSGMGVLFGVEELLRAMPPVFVGGETVSLVSVSGGPGGEKISPSFRNPPERFEPGLQNFAGIIGAGAAVDYLKKIGMDNIERHEETLVKLLMTQLAVIPNVEIVGPTNFEQGKHSTLVSFRLKDERGNLVEADRVSQWMDKNVRGYKVLIRAGGHEAHPFLLKLGISELSLYFYNTEDEIKIFLEALKSFG
jgi:cysteine desulfurase / selenocysteine lyase